MRKQYFLTILSLFLGLFSYAQVSYMGNANSGFGGTVGGSTLNISDDGTTITFAFSRGAGTVNNPVVIYIDSKTGGSANTSNFTDTDDGLRRAISTRNGDASNNPTVTFPSGFTADYAVAFFPGGGTDFGGIWELVESGSHTFVANADLTNNTDQSAATHSLTVDFSEIGITSTDKFDFIVTYIAESAWLSNEVIGDTSSIVEGSSAVGSGNPGNDGSITFSDSRSYPNTWTGTTDNDWATATNWTEGVPATTHNIHIPSGLTNYPTASAAVTINKGTIESGASLIAQSTFAGTLTTQRNLATTNWYLVGAPVAGETIEDMISNNSFDTGTGSNIGWAPYDNSQATATDRWDYQTAASTGSLTSGGGYSVKLSSAGDLTFAGTMETSDVSVSILVGAGNAFNLIGNPYPSFLAANSNADGTNNLLSINFAALNESTLWFWNQGTSSYDQVNQMSSAFYVAPGQGFFVQADTNTTFDFTEAMQSHQSTDSFQRNSNNNIASVILEMTNGTSSRDTEVYYVGNATQGFDNGFDSSIFGGVDHEFEVFTSLVSNSQGQKMGIQSLPDSGFETMIIPVGVIADAGDVSFSVNASNLPSGYMVFLEDKDNGNFIRLDQAGTEYQAKFDSPVNGIGRFFLHTTTNALSNNSVDLTNISTYISEKNNLRIVGIQQGTTQVRMFNILGKQVVNTSFQSNGVDDVTLPNLRQGVYIVQIASEEGTINKKIVIE